MKTNKDSYVVVSKDETRHGKNILVSFASKAIWKDFEALRRQDENIPNCYDLDTAKYALNKYSNGKDFEVVTSEQAEQLLNKYKQDFPNWQ